MFLLVWDWMNEEDGTCLESRVDWFDTKEDLLKAYKENRSLFARHINMGRLILSAAVNHSWSDIENLF